MFFSLLYFFNLHVRQSVTSQLEDVSSYFDFIDDLAIPDPLLPSALAPDGVTATVYDKTAQVSATPEKPVAVGVATEEKARL